MAAGRNPAQPRRRKQSEAPAQKAASCSRTDNRFLLHLMIGQRFHGTLVSTGPDKYTGLRGAELRGLSHLARVAQDGLGGLVMDRRRGMLVDDLPAVAM